MGLTLTAMQAGSVSTCYICAIEGYRYLLTNAPTTAAAVTAWSGTDWTLALPNLFVELDNVQSFNPWMPFQGGGTCVLRVLPPDNPESYGLGIDVGKTSALPETELTATIDRNDTTINVKRADDFTAATSEAFIGNECFAYSAKTSTTFTASIRGKYSPFTPGGTGTRWAGHHRVGGSGANGTNTPPLVTQTRRQWEGALVGVWEHRIVDGVLDTKAEAQLVYAGQIADFGDDPSTMGTVIHLRHILDVIKDGSVLRDQYKARVPVGIEITSDMEFTGTDSDTALGTANALTVEVSGAVAPNQINAGFYTAEDLLSSINSWLASEKAAARLKGDHSYVVEGDHATSTHRFSGGATSLNSWRFYAPERVVEFFRNGTAPALDIFDFGNLFGSTATSIPLSGPIKRHGIVAVFPSDPIVLANESGTFIDNSGYVPASLSAYDDGTNPVGFFLLDGKSLIAGRIDTSELVDAVLVSDWKPSLHDPTPPHADGVELVQVAVIGAAWYRLVLTLAKSSGTPGFNDATYDDLAYGLGWDIPDSLLGDDFDTTALTMPGAGIDSTVWITKPTKMAELLTVDCILRGSHLVWKNGGLRWATWSTPVASNATITLSEDNKAEPEGNEAQQRSATVVSAEWARPIVKIEFDYEPIGDKFASSITLEDYVALSGGQSQSITLKAKNLGFGQNAANAAEILVAELFSRWVPLMSRPITKITRSISPKLYEGYTIGETALITDAFARDPATGIRSITARPGMVLRHRYNPGGLVPGANGAMSLSPQQGEVDLLVMPTNRSTIWSPAAEVDETYSSGGFTNGYNSATGTLRVKEHQHSESTEGVDASNFAADDFITITEIDPTAAPLTWTVELGATPIGSDIVTGTLAAFDTAKRYRVTSATYADAQTSQKTDAYQADDTDGMILDTSPAFHYGLPQTSTIAPTADAHSELAELDPTGVSYGDGLPLDTGYHRALIRTVNNLMDHKTAHQSPALANTAFTTGLLLWDLRVLSRRHFGIQSLGLVRRVAACAVWFRSTSGAPVEIRVTLCPTRPRATTLGDFTWPSPNSQVIFSTSSTTWATSSEDELDLRYLDQYGCAWIGIELKGPAECRGLAQLIERERT